jgi:excisionase family DNA binding protein
MCLPRARLRVQSESAAWHKGGTAPDSATERHRGEEVRQLQAYTVEQVAEMLNIGRDNVYFLLRTGQLRSIKIGKLRRITEQHLAEFIESKETERLTDA